MHRDPLIHRNRVQVRPVASIVQAAESVNRTVESTGAKSQTSQFNQTKARQRAIDAMNMEGMLGHSSIGGTDINSMLG